MRKILSLLIVGILFISFNSELNAQWGKKKNQTPLELPESFNQELLELRYEEIVQLDQDISKQEIFDKLERFIIYNYKSPDDVIQKNDRESAIIITKGLLSNLPDSVTLNVEDLAIGMFIYIKDITIEGCELLAPPNSVVVGVKTARAAIVETVEEEGLGEEGEVDEEGSTEKSDNESPADSSASE